jgi:uncharacterized protein (TIGR02722 family)
MKHFQLTLATAVCAAIPLVSGCSSTTYNDPSETETVNKDYGRTDLQVFTQTMVKSLLDSPALAYLDGPGKREDKRVRLFMGKVDNRTKEHIDTTAITDSIRTELLKSGRFVIVVDPAGQDQIAEQVNFQQGGRVDPEKAKDFGKQTGAEVILYGSLVSIEKTKGRSLESGLSKYEDVYYQFILNATNIESAELIWSEKKELTKSQRIGMFGSG